LAEPRRRATRTRRTRDRIEKRLELPCALSVEPLDRVEQVAVEELRIEVRERIRPRDEVDADALAEREQRAGLSRDERERVLQGREQVAVLREDVRLGMRRRVDAHPPRLRGDLVPDLALGDAALERRRREAEGLAPAE